MKVPVLSVLFSFFVFSLALGSTEESLSFKDWKQRQTNLAQASMNSAQVDFNLQQRQKVKPERLAAIANRLQQAKLNLEVAEGLNLNDYVVLYLANIENEERLAAAVKQLAPTELMEIFKSYGKPKGASAEDTPSTKWTPGQGLSALTNP